MALHDFDRDVMSLCDTGADENFIRMDELIEQAKEDDSRPFGPEMIMQAFQAGLTALRAARAGLVIFRALQALLISGPLRAGPHGPSGRQAGLTALRAETLLA